MTQEDLSARPSVGNVILNFGNVDSRAELGDNSFNSIEFVADEDAIGARIIDTYAKADVVDADGERVAWKDYSIVDEYASSNYQYVYNGEKWETTALMVEGNYMFYFPYNAKNVSRGPLEIITPTHQTIKPNEEGGDRNAIAELYAGETPAFVGYKFISAENQGLTQNVEMQHLFAYPQITLVNDFEVENKKGDKVETDLTITKIVLSADNLFEKYTVNHTNFRKNLTGEVSYLAKATDEEETICIEAGDWTDAETFLKKASIASIAAANDKKVEITVEFEDGLELGFGEEYSFNVVLPAAAYESGSLEMKVYTDDDKMIGKVVNKVEAVEYFTNAKDMTFAPGKRYATQEYNFPNVGNPAPKKTAGNHGVYELGGDDLCLIDAVAPVAVINTIEEFEAFLQSIDKNVETLKEISKDNERNAEENNFILTEAVNTKGEKLGYANLVVNEALLALLDEYNYDGAIEFISTMNIEGATAAPSEEDEIEEFLLGNKDYSMTFKKAVVKSGYVTVNQYTEATESLVVEGGLVTVKGNDEKSATIAAAIVKGGEMKIQSAKFDPSKVTASYGLNKAGDAVATTGKVTLDFTGEAKAANVDGHATITAAFGTMEIGSNVVITEMGTWSKGAVVNAGKITAAVTVPTAGTLTNNGTITGDITNNGIVNANKNMTVKTNNGKIVVYEKKTELTVSGGTNGKVDNTVGGKVQATGQDVYATLTSLKNDGEDADGDVVLSKKYDKHSGVTKYVLTGEWEVEENTSLLEVNSVDRKVEFASGSSLYIHSGATLTLMNDVIVAANVTWAGRDAEDAELNLNDKKIVFNKTTAGVYYTVTENNLKITTNGTNQVYAQVELLKEAAANGGNVTLTGDLTLANGIDFKKESVINLNGKTVTYADYGFKTDAATAKLTISGGKMTTTREEFSHNAYAVYANAGKVIINGGTYFAENKNGGTAELIYAENTGAIEINGGTFETKGADSFTKDGAYNATGALLNIKNGATTASIKVNAGVFKSIAQENIYENNWGNWTESWWTNFGDGGLEFKGTSTWSADKKTLTVTAAN